MFEGFVSPKNKVVDMNGMFMLRRNVTFKGGKKGHRYCLIGKQNNPRDSSSAGISTASLSSLCSICLFYTFRMISLLLLFFFCWKPHSWIAPSLFLLLLLLLLQKYLHPQHESSTNLEEVEPDAG